MSLSDEITKYRNYSQNVTVYEDECESCTINYPDEDDRKACGLTSEE